MKRDDPNGWTTRADRNRRRADDRAVRQGPEIDRQSAYLIGQLQREGRVVYYVIDRSGRCREFANEAAAVVFLERNKYLRADCPGHIPPSFPSN